MIEKFEEIYEVTVVHAWGMTEMSPVGTICSIKPDYGVQKREALFDLKSKQGSAAFTVEMKIIDDAGKELPRDGKTFGRLVVRGAGVAKSYFKGEGGNILDKDGFFDTGDVATIDAYGTMQITDRAKDVIKSGGEWISSIDIENMAVGHPDVAEAAVIGVLHPKWDERPLLVIVPKEGKRPSKGDILQIHGGQDRQVVDARRRGVRRRDPAHRDRQDPQDGAARPVQGLSLPNRRGLTERRPPADRAAATLSRQRGPLPC